MNGVMNFLKPPGMSSNGAVVFSRGVLGVRKTGHAGTLDPGACGVLPICVGKATKISSFLMGGSKEYIAEIAFGRSTDTGDSYGVVTAHTDAELPTQVQVQNVLTAFKGCIMQQTPMYSAAKHEGRKLYKLARKGIEVTPKMRKVVIEEIEYLSQTRQDAHIVRVVCGKGTYIRTLCEDIGKNLGSLAYMSFLARTKCAGLNINDGVTADELKSIEDKKNVLIPTAHFLRHLPRIDASINQRSKLFNGNDVGYSGDDNVCVCVYVGDELLGIGKIENKRLKITTRLVDK